MWGKNPTAPKCTRNDCKFYACKPEAAPCANCTCNRSSDPFGRSFGYEHREEVNQNAEHKR